MSILITGVAGFIGSNLCKRLVKSKKHVIGVDNLEFGDYSTIASLEDSEYFEFVRADVNNQKALERIFSNNKISTIFHLASNSDVREGMRNPKLDEQNTYMTTLNILKKCSEYRIEKFIFTSSSAVYGQKNGICRETDELVAISNYGFAKIRSEKLIIEFSEKSNIQSVILRFPNVIGRTSKRGVIPDLIEKIESDESRLRVLGNGEQRKQYLHVDDAISALIYFSEKDKMKNCEIINIAPKDSTQVREIVEKCLDKTGKDKDVAYSKNKKGWKGDVFSYLFDTEKMNKLGWKPKYSSNEAVDKVINEYINGR